ncbi:nuclear transport factor 2 family protein [Sphingobium nicotianae]|uniref:Nuclear transport factor 2 family protein n=1 Tax=Sphingobium nicotianae TaxID=2782607 RepID=A0A9X1DAT8_9SPHN|nr:nuclear transport factor 2 family protein [Sphingobium nicotianae]MBT2186547.1 nuclear transport factor 2 family protein [Sphingobium nicotianae]
MTRQTPSRAVLGLTNDTTPTLTPQDYIEIQQLNACYAIYLDDCTDDGYAYADLYTDDGTFGVSEKWGDPGATYARTRDERAIVAGGGPHGRQPPRFGTSHHVIVNHRIEPRPGGAWGRCTLIAMKLDGDPARNEPQGGYEDFYVKTADGWRFKSRVHVFPNIKSSLQFGPESPYAL